MNFTEATPFMNLQLKSKGKYDLLFISLVFLLSFSSVFAKDETVIKLEALEKRLIILEQENAKLTERIQRLEKTGTETVAQQPPGLIPKDESDRKAFFDKFRREFKSSQDQARGPWTAPGPWTKIRKRMSDYSVRETLGRPTRMRPSVKPSVAVVYFYTGDLNSDGVDEEGYVEFKDKRVVSFQSPHQSK